MPRSAGHRRQDSPAVRIPPGQSNRDPLVELAVNGQSGLQFIMGRLSTANLTITNDVIRVIHPTGYDENGDAVSIAGLIDPYTPDGPFWLPRSGDVSLNDIGFDTQIERDIIHPFGSVILVAGWKFTGGKPGSPYVLQEFDGSFGFGTMDCGGVILTGNRRRAPNWWENPDCETYQSWNGFCFIFPSAPGCSACSVTVTVCDGDAYVGLTAGGQSPEGSGDIMRITGGSNGNVRQFYTGANRYRQVDKFGSIQTKEDSTGSWFVDSGLGPLDGGQAIKAFQFGLGPSFVEDPSPREVQIELTDDFGFDPGHPTLYNPGGTSYQFFVRAFAGGGNSYVAEPGTTRTGAHEGRRNRANIGSTRRPASGVRGSVSGT